jgi:hypothetical protein
MTRTDRQLQVLNLYRSLLRAKKSLKYTNKDFYIYLLKKEFRNYQSLTDEAQIQFQIQKGLNFYNTQLGGLQ